MARHRFLSDANGILRKWHDLTAELPQNPRNILPEKRSLDKYGFTLMELVLAMCVAVVIAGAAGSLFYFHGSLIKESMQTVKYNFECQLAMNHMLENIEKSAWIEVVNSNHIVLHSHSLPSATGTAAGLAFAALPPSSPTGPTGLREYVFANNGLTFTEDGVTTVLIDGAATPVEAVNFFQGVGVARSLGGTTPANRYQTVRIQFWRQGGSAEAYQDQNLFYGSAYASSHEDWNMLYVTATPGPVGDGTCRYPFRDLGSALDMLSPTSPIFGDINGDGYVNSDDIAIIAACFGYSIGDACYIMRADLNIDYVLDGIDVQILLAANTFGTGESDAIGREVLFIENGDYELFGDVDFRGRQLTFRPETSLTLRQGITLRMGPATRLYIEGRFICAGRPGAGNSVTIRSIDPASYITDAIWINPKASALRAVQDTFDFSYVDISYMRNGVIIRPQDTALAVNAVISYNNAHHNGALNEFALYRIHGVRTFNAHHNTFSDNNVDLWLINPQTYGLASSISIRENTFTNTISYPIRIDNIRADAPETVLVRNNTLTNTGGISYSEDATSTGPINTTISNNDIRGWIDARTAGPSSTLTIRENNVRFAGNAIRVSQLNPATVTIANNLVSGAGMVPPEEGDAPVVMMFGAEGEAPDLSLYNVVVRNNIVECPDVGTAIGSAICSDIRNNVIYGGGALYLGAENVVMENNTIIDSQVYHWDANNISMIYCISRGSPPPAFFWKVSYSNVEHYVPSGAYHNVDVAPNWETEPPTPYRLRHPLNAFNSWADIGLPDVTEIGAYGGDGASDGIGPQTTPGVTSTTPPV